MKGQFMKERTPVKENSTRTAAPLIHNSSTDTPHPACKLIEVNSPLPVTEHVNKNGRAYLALLGAAALSGLVLSACFFPMSWGVLAWVALVPLLFLVRSNVRPIWVYFCAWVAGSVFYWTTLLWMPYSNHLMRNAWIGVSIYCSLYFPLTLYLIRALDRRTRLPLLVTAPVVWVALDFVRSFMLTGFPWYFLGHSQHIFLPVIQIADIGGAYLVTFLVVMVNAVFVQWLCLLPPVRRLFRLPEPAADPLALKRICWVQTAVVALLVVLTLCYGSWRLGQNDFDQGPRVAVLQGNIAQKIRNEQTEEQQSGSAGEARKAIATEYAALCNYAAEFPFKVDLIVWPETSFPDLWTEINRDIPIQQIPAAWENMYNMSREEMRQITQRFTETNMLIGLHTIYLAEPKKESWYNSALLVHANGSIGGRYDKIHRLPFGEYTPLEWPVARYFSPYKDMDYGILAGKELKRFKLNNYTFGVLICYEDTDPVLARQYGTTKNAGLSWDPVRRLENLRRWLDGIEQVEGPPVDFLINISNDGWYAGTSEHNEHLAISRFRAVEARRSIARAVNMGISAVIDGNGRVMKPDHFDYPKKTQKGDYVFYWDVDDNFEKVPNLSVTQWNEFKKRSAVLTSLIPIDHRFSLYALWGDWFVYVCLLVLVIGLVWPAAGRIPHAGP